MKNKGYLLIDVILYVLLISITLIGIIEMFLISIKLNNKLTKYLEGRENVRIATEFLIEKIQTSESISLNDNFLIIDGKKIYLNNDVLIYEYKSTPIVDKIKFFKVTDIGRGLYEVHISSENYSNKTIVKKR